MVTGFWCSWPPPRAVRQQLSVRPGIVWCVVYITGINAAAGIKYGLDASKKSHGREDDREGGQPKMLFQSIVTLLWKVMYVPR